MLRTEGRFLVTHVGSLVRPPALIEFLEKVRDVPSDGLGACLQEGPVGGSEGQARDDDIRQRLALDIDALPEAIHAEQHRVAGRPELLQHLCSRQTVALAE